MNEVQLIEKIQELRRLDVGEPNWVEHEIAELETQLFVKQDVLEGECKHEYLDAGENMRCRKCGDTYIPVSGVGQVFIDECSG